MKRIVSVICIGLISVLFKQCTPEDVESASLQTVQFTLASDDKSVETSLSTLSPGATAIVTVETATGESLVADQSLKLVSTGSGYLTEPLRLPPGRYIVSSFAVFDENSQPLYVAPDRIEGTISGTEDETSERMVMHLRPCHGNPGGKGRLKEFVFTDRHYNFFYNWRGAIDSIVGTDVYNNYVYRVVYTRGRIDSVGIYDHGQYVSVNRDFKFDHRGRIIAYNYFLLNPTRSPAMPVDIHYDFKGRVVAIGGNTLLYRFDNVAWFQNPTEYFTYTHDAGKNPFKGIDNLAVIMVEERWIWRYVFSKNNPVSRTDSNGTTFNFNNVYDSRSRLISNGEMLFSYY